MQASELRIPLLLDGTIVIGNSAKAVYFSDRCIVKRGCLLNPSTYSSRHKLYNPGIVQSSLPNLQSFEKKDTFLCVGTLAYIPFKGLLRGAINLGIITKTAYLL